MVKGTIFQGMTGVARATTKLVKKIAVQEKGVTSDVPAPESNGKLFYFDAYNAAADFAKREAVNKKNYTSLERSGDGWVVRLEADDRIEITKDFSQSGVRELSEKIVKRIVSVVSNLKEKVIGLDYDYGEHGCGTHYINQRLGLLAEQNKGSVMPTQLDGEDFKVDEEVVLLHYKKFLEMSELDLDALWEKRNNLDLEEFEGLRLAVRAKKGLTRLAEMPMPSVCPTCFMVGDACTCQNH